MGLLTLSLSFDFNAHCTYFDRIDPILPEDRTDTKLYQMFFVWFSANFNILAYVRGLGLSSSVIHRRMTDLAPDPLVLRSSGSAFRTRSWSCWSLIWCASQTHAAMAED